MINKNIKSLFFAALATATLASCQKDDDVVGYIPSTDYSAIENPTSHARLMDKVMIDIPVSAQVKTVEIFKGGKSIASKEAGEGEKVSFEFDQKMIGYEEDAAKLKILITEKSGKQVHLDKSYSLYNPVSLSDASLTRKVGDTTAIFYEVSTKNAKITAVEYQMKVGKNADYTTIARKDAWATDKDSVNVIPYGNYNLGDTLYLKAIAKAGEISQEFEKAFPIGIYTFGETFGDKFTENSADASFEFDMVKVEKKYEGSDSEFITDINMKLTNSNRMTEFVGNGDIEFIHNYDEDKLDITDQQALKDAFTDDTIVKESSFKVKTENLVGKAILVKMKRGVGKEEVMVYGYFEIEDIKHHPHESYIEFNYIYSKVSNEIK